MIDSRHSRGDQVLVTVGRGGKASEQPATVLKANGSVLLVRMADETKWVRTERTRPQPEEATCSTSV
jgi:hypothetical protein